MYSRKDLVGSGADVREMIRVTRRAVKTQRTAPNAPPTKPPMAARRSRSSASKITSAITRPRPAAERPRRPKGPIQEQSVATQTARKTLANQKFHPDHAGRRNQA